MLTPNSPTPGARTGRSMLYSAAAHAVVLLAIFGALHHAPQLAAYRLPGTAQGTRLISYYSPGSPEHAVSTLAAKLPEKAKPTALPALEPAVVAAPTAPTPTLNAEAGTGTSAQSGLGQGDISIALPKFFPHPKPDLDSLAPGTRGDVILNAVIDEQGKIADLTLVKGLGAEVDNQVIAIVRQWTYAPAIRNGAPVRSEQELHFHYEHS